MDSSQVLRTGDVHVAAVEVLPADPKMMVWLLVLAPARIDQGGEIMACSLRIQMCRVCSGLP